MDRSNALEAALRGYRDATPLERAASGILSGFSLTIAISRTVNYVREQHRAAPRLRSVGRALYHAPGKDKTRVHHFLPGMGLACATGLVAIVARADGREAWLGPAFGTGIGLTMDELPLLIQLDNPYWGGENLALLQSATAGLASLALGVRFHRRGLTALRR